MYDKNKRYKRYMACYKRYRPLSGLCGWVFWSKRIFFSQKNAYYWGAYFWHIWMQFPSVIYTEKICQSSVTNVTKTVTRFSGAYSINIYIYPFPKLCFSHTRMCLLFITPYFEAVHVLRNLLCANVTNVTKLWQILHVNWWDTKFYFWLFFHKAWCFWKLTTSSFHSYQILVSPLTNSNVCCPWL